MKNNFQRLESEGVGRGRGLLSDQGVEESSSEEGTPSTELNVGRGARQRGQTVQRP